MPLSDTSRRYGTITRLFHWTVALLLFWQLGGMIMKNILGRVPVMKFWVGTHASIGVLLFVIIALRALWTLRQRHRRPGYQPGFIGKAARAGHILLYALMIIVPGIAILRMAGNGKGITLFNVELSAPTGQEIAWMTAPANAVHGLLAWTLLVLIVGHIVMVLVHHFWWRDNIPYRMVGSHPSN